MQQRTQYRCLYTAQLTYSATLITNPKPNKQPKTDQRARRPLRGRWRRRRGGHPHAGGAVRHVRAVVAEQVEQRVDDLGVELRAGAARGAPPPPRRASSPRGRGGR